MIIINNDDNGVLDVNFEYNWHNILVFFVVVVDFQHVYKCQMEVYCLNLNLSNRFRVRP